MPDESAYTVSINSEQDLEPLSSFPLRVTDHAGRRRQGHVTILPHLPPSGLQPPEDEDFRIVLLSKPPQGDVRPGEGVVVSAPAYPLASDELTAREPAAPYRTSRQSDLDLSPRNSELLAQGRLFAPAPLRLTPKEVFHDGKARLTLLARDLLAGQALLAYLEPIATAMSAPAAPAAASEDVFTDLKGLIDSLSPGDAEVQQALDRLSELVFAQDTSEMLAAAERIYPTARSLMEDIYLLRAFRERAQRAAEVLDMQRFLRQAAVPADEADLALDRSLAMEQLTFATLVAEPQRIPPASAMMHSFRSKYTVAYREHHTRYWSDMARLNARLREEQPRADALRRLNTIAELGPPAGIGALTAYEELVTETAGCPLIGGVEEMIETEAVCPDCGLTMERTAPTQRVEEILGRIDRAGERQLARLSSSAVQQVLRRSNDARVEQFLKMVQASQLSSLADVTSDELVGYLRRFLVESRIEDALRPILDQLQEGVSPTVENAQGAMRDITQALNTAFRAAQRSLPPAEGQDKGKQTPRRKRKR